VGAATIAWFLLGESLNTAQVVGSLIVLVGIMLAETARRAPHPLRPSSGEGEGEGEASTHHTEGASPLPEGIAP
jgi:hypothetical protein